MADRWAVFEAIHAVKIRFVDSSAIGRRSSNPFAWPMYFAGIRTVDGSWTPFGEAGAVYLRATAESRTKGTQIALTRSSNVPDAASRILVCLPIRAHACAMSRLSDSSEITMESRLADATTAPSLDAVMD
jgi:hypothetical protein